MSEPIYRGYTQQELDAQYDNQRAYPAFREVIARYRAGSAAAAAHCVARDLAYGEHPRERLDLYGGGRERRPVLVVFVHGGAWLQLEKEDSAFAAPAFVEAGCDFAALGFRNVPDTTLAGMVDAVRRAVGWLARGGDGAGQGRRLVLVGHSSGSHLVNQCLTHDWAGHGVDPRAIAGAALVSGLCDLEPVRLSYRNRMLGLAPADVEGFSLARQAPTVAARLVCAWADGETDEFRRQGRAAAEHWRAHGGRADVIEVGGRNHFDVALDLADPASTLFHAVLALARGAAPGVASGHTLLPQPER